MRKVWSHGGLLALTGCVSTGQGMTGQGLTGSGIAHGRIDWLVDARRPHGQGAARLPSSPTVELATIWPCAPFRTTRRRSTGSPTNA